MFPTALRACAALFLCALRGLASAAPVAVLVACLSNPKPVSFAAPKPAARARAATARFPTSGNPGRPR